MKFLIKNTSYWMIKNFDLLSIILVTCLTWLSRLDLSKSTSIILKEPTQPQPIFVSDFVRDFSNGNLSDAINSFVKNDVILIYLYSHWDEESVFFKNVIEHLAETIKNKIPVVAINCWNNQSQCHNAIKPNRFPQVYAFVSNYLLVEYKRSIDSNELLRFANSLFYPFHFPRTSNELDELFKLYDATFIICINSQSSYFSKKVKIFHQISSLYKGKGDSDPNIGFILLSEADELFVDVRQTLGLSVNEAILYSVTGLKKKYTGKFLADNVLQYLRENTVRPTVTKYSPTGIKSLFSQELMMDGLLVIYVHNEKDHHHWDNVKSRFNFYSSALQMRKCTSKSEWSVSVDEMIDFKRELIISGRLQYFKENFICQQFYQSKFSTNNTVNILSLVPSLSANNSRHFSDYVVDPFVTSSNLLEIDWTCRKHSILTDHDTEKINLFIEAPLLRQSLYFDDTAKINCQEHFNRSIHFAELDGSVYPKLLENWGIYSGDTALPQVIVVDWKNEMVHHMQSPISQYSLNDLVSRVFLHNLTIHMKSDRIVSSESLHVHFPAIDAVKLDQELNDPKTDLVVYYYTPWCAYCSSLSNFLIMLSRYFSKYPTIHFSSLNTFSNDLPCKFQSERVPALIMYPRGRKSESVIFHLSEENLSLSSLIRFVLENSGDLSLSLNSPSLIFDDGHQVTCDRSCLSSAHDTIVELLGNLRATLRYLDHRIECLHRDLQEVCSHTDFGVLELRVDLSRDWRDYKERQWRRKYWGRLISDVTGLTPRAALLSGKMSRLTRISRGIKDVMRDGVYGVYTSVESMAADIITRST